MVTRLGAGFVFAVSHAEGHAHQQFPISRQYGWSRDFYDSKFDNVENAPYAYNAGGVKDVQDRAAALTDPDVLAAAGNGDQFPLYYMDLAENGNYLETNEIAKRHGVCGDPRLGVDTDTNTYSTPNADWPVIDSFTSGEVIEMDVVVVYYHWGHFEFFLCDVQDLEDPDGVVTQECLNKYPLDRAYDADDASAIDPKYPGRYYTDPQCRKEGEVEQTVSSNMPEVSYNIKMRYKLPDIECEHCVLQMHYLTGNRCKHIGYDEFDPPSWNSDCAPDTDDWIDTSQGSVCGAGQSYPEEFWSCSDIAITAALSPAPSAAPSPAPSPVPTEFPSAAPTSASPTASPTSAPVSTAAPTASRASSSPTAISSDVATSSPVASGDREIPTNPPRPATEQPVAATTSPPSAAGTTDRDRETAAPTAEAGPRDSGAPGVNPALRLVLIVVLLAVGFLSLEM